jgi:hypothetical protein
MDSDPHGRRRRPANGHEKLVGSPLLKTKRVTSAKTEITRLESKRAKD